MLIKEGGYGLFHWVVYSLRLLIMAQTKIYKNVSSCIENEMYNYLKSWPICQLFQILNNETWLINVTISAG